MLRFWICDRAEALRPQKPGFYRICGLQRSILEKNPVSRLPSVQDGKKYFKKGLTNLGEFGSVINVERKRCSASSLTQTQDSKFSKLSWCL